MHTYVVPTGVLELRHGIASWLSPPNPALGLRIWGLETPTKAFRNIRSYELGQLCQRARYKRHTVESYANKPKTLFSKGSRSSCEYGSDRHDNSKEPFKRLGIH